MRTRPLARRLSLVAALVAVVGGLTACNAPPRDSFQQWVARDAWDQSCAEHGMIEQWKAENGRWKVEHEVYVVDVEATIKLANECSSGLPPQGIDVKALLEKGGGAVAR
ncbi:MAG TPA: hypothetical protein VGF99_19200, partial [Myxococcota bacterium]